MSYSWIYVVLNYMVQVIHMFNTIWKKTLNVVNFHCNPLKKKKIEEKPAPCFLESSVFIFMMHMRLLCEILKLKLLVLTLSFDLSVNILRLVCLIKKLYQ